MARISTHDDRLPAPLWVVELLDRGEEGVQVDVENGLADPR
jgi:hypothetical protein